MNDPLDPPNTESNGSPHLDEDRELRAVAALLRDLPDPEPPDQLVERIMARVAEYEAQPRVLRLLRHVSEPAVATALAAGIGCLLLMSAIQGGLLQTDENGPETTLLPTRATRIATTTVGDADAARRSRPVVPSFASTAVVDPRFVGLQPSAIVDGRLLDLGPTPTGVAGLTFDSGRVDPVDQRLDLQLNRLLLDPNAFFERLDRIQDPERFVARLANRAARRGDAAEMYLRLRHDADQRKPGAMLVDRLLRASLERRVPDQQ